MRIVIILFIATFLPIQVIAQKAPAGVEINLRNSDDFVGFEVFDSLALKAQVIMTGENHTFVSFNAKMEMKMLRYLNKKVGLRNFVIELGEARAHFLNRYINDKDSMAEKYLKAATSPRYMDLFLRLRKYNLELPDSLRIVVWGIDVERFNDLPLMRLNELLPKGKCPDNIRVGVETIRGIGAYLLETGLKDYENALDEKTSSRFDYKSPPFYTGPTTRRIIRYFDSLKTEFELWLGKDFTEVENVIGWLKQYKQWKDYDGSSFQYVWREENIFRNLIALLDANESDKFYGQFGRCHVAYEEQNGDCGWYGYHSVINKLKTRYFKEPEKLLSIGLFYEGYSEYNYSDKEDREHIRKEIEAMSDKTKKKTVMLFDLRSEDAELPELKKKFSFAIINNHAVIEDADSVVSEIKKTEEPLEYESGAFLAISYGFGASTIPYTNFSSYLNSNGKTPRIKSAMWQSPQMEFYGKRWDLGVGLTFRSQDTAYTDDTAVLQYRAGMGTLKLGYNIVSGKHFRWTVGIAGARGRERLRYTLKNSDLFTVNPVEEFYNYTWIGGAYTKVNYRFLNYMFIGFEAMQTLDLTNSQFYIKGSNLKFGNPNEISNGFTGLFYIFRFGFVGDID